jgi:PAS domain S-box-containing protein
MSNITSLHQNFTWALLTSNIVSVTDANGIIIWVNDNFCQLCGYSPEELIGHSHSLLSNGTHTREMYKSLWDTITHGAIWQGELQNRKKNGSQYWDEIKIIPLLNDDNKSEQFLALHTDVSSRKELIRSLKKHANRQGLLAILGMNAATERNLQTSLEQIISVVTTTLNMSTGMILQAIKPDKLLLRAGFGAHNEVAGITKFTTRSGDLAHLVYASDQPTIIDDFKNDIRFISNDFFDRQDIKRGVLLPVGDLKAPWGMLAVFTDQDEVITSDDIFFISAINNLITKSVSLFDMQERLSSEKELSKRYLDMANVMFVAINESGNIILANQKASLILGYGIDEILSMNWFDKFLPEADRQTSRLYFNELIHNPGSSSDITSEYLSDVITRSGQTRKIKWHNTIIHDHQNNTVSMLSAGEDITDQLRAEAENTRLQQQLQQAKKLETIGHLASGIAHDFNNILTSILGYTGLAMEKPAIQNDQKLLAYLTEIEKSSHKAESIISQLSNFGKDGSKTLQLTLLPALVKSSINMLRSAIPNSISIEQYIDTDTPAVLMAGEKFNQLMISTLIQIRNLMSQTGKIQIILKAVNIPAENCTSCHKPLHGNYVQLAIGSNLSPGHKSPHLVFDSESPSNNTAELIQLDHISHELGGHLLYKSTEEAWIQICLLFPVARIAELPVANEKPVTRPGASIMVVDDENSVAGYLGELLEQYHYKATIFTNAGDAIKDFRNNPNGYDLILTDLTMPVLTGLDLANSVFKIRPEIPVILMTGYNDSTKLDLAAANNIRNLLTKPLETHKLLENINALLEESH